MKLIFGEHYAPYQLASNKPITNPHSFLEASNDFLSIIPGLYTKEKMQSTYGWDRISPLDMIYGWCTASEIQREITTRIIYAEETYNKNIWDMVNITSFMYTLLYSDLKDDQKLDKTTLLKKIFAILQESSTSNRNVNIINLYEQIHVKRACVTIAETSFKQDNNMLEKNLNHKVITFFKSRPHLFRSLQLFYVNTNQDTANIFIQHICSASDFNKLTNLDKAEGHFSLFTHDFKFFLSTLINPAFKKATDFKYPQKYGQKDYFLTLKKTCEYLFSTNFFHTIQANCKTQHLILFQWDRMLLLRWQFYFLSQPELAYKINCENWVEFYSRYNHFVDLMSIEKLFYAHIENTKEEMLSTMQNSLHANPSYFTQEEKDLLLSLNCPHKSSMLFDQVVNCFKPIISSFENDFSL